MRRGVVTGAVLLLLVGLAVFCWRDAESKPTRSAALAAAGSIAVDVHMRGLDHDVFVLDLLGDTAAPTDLAKIVFATCAVLHREHPRAALALARRGVEQYLVDADSVRELGDDDERPLARMRLLPVRARPLTGAAAFAEPHGGALFSMRAVAENMTAFAKAWMGAAP